MYTDPLTGIQIVASQSGFGARFEAAKLLMPPATDPQFQKEQLDMPSEMPVNPAGAGLVSDDDQTEDGES